MLMQTTAGGERLFYGLPWRDAPREGARACAPAPFACRVRGSARRAAAYGAAGAGVDRGSIGDTFSYNRINGVGLGTASAGGSAFHVASSTPGGIDHKVFVGKIITIEPGACTSGPGVAGSIGFNLELVSGTTDGTVIALNQLANLGIGINREPAITNSLLIRNVMSQVTVPFGRTGSSSEVIIAPTN